MKKWMWEWVVRSTRQLSPSTRWTQPEGVWRKRIVQSLMMIMQQQQQATCSIGFHWPNSSASPKRRVNNWAWTIFICIVSFVSQALFVGLDTWDFSGSSNSRLLLLFLFFSYATRGSDERCQWNVNAIETGDHWTPGAERQLFIIIITERLELLQKTMPNDNGAQIIMGLESFWGQLENADDRGQNLLLLLANFVPLKRLLGDIFIQSLCLGRAQSIGHREGLGVRDWQLLTLGFHMLRLLVDLDPGEASSFE